MSNITIRDQAELLLDQAHTVQQAIAAVTADGHGPGSLVAVRINASGQVIKTAVSPRSTEVPSDRLAEEFTAAHGAAMRDLSSQIRQIAGDLVTDRDAYLQMSRW